MKTGGLKDKCTRRAIMWLLARRGFRESLYVRDREVALDSDHYEQLKRDARAAGDTGKQARNQAPTWYARFTGSIKGWDELEARMATECAQLADHPSFRAFMDAMEARQSGIARAMTTCTADELPNLRKLWDCYEDIITVMVSKTKWVQWQADEDRRAARMKEDEIRRDATLEGGRLGFLD